MSGTDHSDTCWMGDPKERAHSNLVSQKTDPDGTVHTVRRHGKITVTCTAYPASDEAVAALAKAIGIEWAELQRRKKSIQSGGAQ